ncbi:MAG: hypothetical protein MTP17_04735 [Candidatus Midichloria sp.]|nr:MAG: hypothetical protein MTP17_04735 [Candidatus Midichloria sp.]
MQRTLEAGPQKLVIIKVFLCDAGNAKHISILEEIAQKNTVPGIRIYTRFKRWSRKWFVMADFICFKIEEDIKIDIVFMDSTTVKVHLHGTGAFKKEVGKGEDNGDAKLC